MVAERKPNGFITGQEEREDSTQNCKGQRCVCMHAIKIFWLRLRWSNSKLNFITGQNEREENTQDKIVTQKVLRTQAMRSTT
jgi:hypothetical protein